MEASLRRPARGFSLVEGMVTAAVLAVGILGALQGMIVASQQNSIAYRMTRATVVAAQVRAGLLGQSRARLTSATGPLLPSRCTSDAAVKARAGGLEAMVPAPCIIDLDAFDLGTAAGTDAVIVPGFTAADRDVYSRVLVWTTDAANGLDTIGVVVSFRAAGQRRFHQQFAVVYDPSVSQVGVEL